MKGDVNRVFWVSRVVVVAILYNESSVSKVTSTHLNIWSYRLFNDNKKSSLKYHRKYIQIYCSKANVKS